MNCCNVGLNRQTWPLSSSNRWRHGFSTRLLVCTTRKSISVIRLFVGIDDLRNFGEHTFWITWFNWCKIIISSNFFLYYTMLVILFIFHWNFKSNIGECLSTYWLYLISKDSGNIRWRYGLEPQKPLQLQSRRARARAHAWVRKRVLSRARASACNETHVQPSRLMRYLFIW